MRTWDKVWLDRLDRFAPDGIRSKGVDNVNDAYRHYMTAAELTRLSGFADMIVGLGEVSEAASTGRTPASTFMDLQNNAAGVDSGLGASSAADNALNFFFDVLEGNVLVLDDNGEPRPTDIHDLPDYDGDRNYDKVEPDTNGPDDPLDFGDDGVMVA
jgi:hypothetical protein